MLVDRGNSQIVTSPIEGDAAEPYDQDVTRAFSAGGNYRIGKEVLPHHQRFHWRFESKDEEYLITNRDLGGQMHIRSLIGGGPVENISGTQGLSASTPIESNKYLFPHMPWPSGLHKTG